MIFGLAKTPFLNKKGAEVWMMAGGYNMSCFFFRFFVVFGVEPNIGGFNPQNGW